jgi:hypothetical protein
MLGAAFLVAAYGVFGAALARKLSSDDDGGWERALRAAVAALAAWVAVSWVLALTRTFTTFTIIGAAVSAAVSGGFMLVRSGRRAKDERAISPSILAVVLPLLLWVLYVGFRATVIPIGNHDAIAYHLPRAVLFLVDHGYRWAPDIGEPRLSKFPADYELLVSNVLGATGSDHGTILVGLLGYLGVCLVGGAACARFSRSGLAPLLTCALVAATPMALLHGGAHKNDALFAFFAAAAVHWLAPFAFRGRLADGLYGVTALALALGTKPHGALLGGLAAPLLALGLWRLRSARGRLLVLGHGVVAALLLGGCVIVENVVRGGELGLSMRTLQTPAGSMYGDWANVWRFPVTILAAPFTSSGNSLWVPWSPDRYWWGEFDLFFGDYGALFTICVLLLPVLAWKAGGACTDKKERVVALGVLLVLVMAMLPVRARPYGMFMQQARYFLAIVPFVYAWAVSAALELARPNEKAGVVLLVLAGGWFVWNAQRIARKDGNQPLDLVLEAAVAPEPLREPPVQLYHRRVGYLVDRVAGPRDVVAVDLGYDTWLYPMFGADFRRPLRLLSSGSAIPPEAAWVAIDRGHQEIFFVHPKFEDLSRPMLAKYWGRGKLDPSNLELYERMKTNPDFDLVYDDRSRNQALFRRRVSPPSPSPP